MNERLSWISKAIDQKKKDWKRLKGDIFGRDHSSLSKDYSQSRFPEGVKGIGQ